MMYKYACVAVSSENDDSGDYRKIFGSSDSDSEFEKFLEHSKQRRRDRNKDGRSDDDTERTAKQLNSRRPKKLKKPKAGRGGKPYRNKENLVKDEEGEDEEEEVEVEVVKQVPPKPRFKRRTAGVDSGILEGFLERGLDKEDVQMFKLALAGLKSEGDLLACDLAWAHYPHNILIIIVN